MVENCSSYICYADIAKSEIKFIFSTELISFMIIFVDLYKWNSSNMHTKERNGERETRNMGNQTNLLKILRSNFINVTCSTAYLYMVHGSFAIFFLQNVISFDIPFRWVQATSIELSCAQFNEHLRNSWVNQYICDENTAVALPMYVFVFSTPGDFHGS